MDKDRPQVNRDPYFDDMMTRINVQLEEAVARGTSPYAIYGLEDDDADDWCWEIVSSCETECADGRSLCWQLIQINQPFPNVRVSVKRNSNTHVSCGSCTNARPMQRFLQARFLIWYGLQTKKHSHEKI